MNTSQFLLIAVGGYILIGIAMIIFAEPIYAWARESRMSDFGKGLFARAIISYYNIKTKGFSAGMEHWGYCAAFNTGVSLAIALAVTAGLTIIAIIIGIIAALLLFWIIGIVISNL